MYIYLYIYICICPCVYMYAYPCFDACENKGPKGVATCSKAMR